ncbi:hypothetical protein [Paraglaciecola arctica]|uniref:Uncharacterized protein n=1 Tax=Paraglaciecola arctica BSs20135 TaxID=493475 RepID=K6YQ66_9ALTE|nr:hypothetical protein [Paraglaciecola arctica]GAC20287.1 hypothetical protein GARC_3329 [Paraglaciecola arctica BSs20135]
MSHRLINNIYILPISLVIILNGCTTHIARSTKLPAIQIADEVLDEWGSVTASPPIISIPADEYEFKIDKTSQQYYQGAKDEVNAGILQHTKTVFSFLLAASTQADATTKALYENQFSNYENAVAKIETGKQLTDEEKKTVQDAKKNIVDSLAKAAKENFTTCTAIADGEDDRVTGDISVSDAITLNNAAVNRRKDCLNDYQLELKELATVSQLPDFPTLPENNVPALNRLQTTPFVGKTDLNGEGFSLSNSNLKDSLSLPDYNALPQAATNKFLADMLTTISSNDEKNAYFGVSMISVNPGWRTKEGYHAVVNLNPTVLLDQASKATVRKYIEDQSVDDELKNLIRANYIDACEYDTDTNKEIKQLSLVRDEKCEKRYKDIVKKAKAKHAIKSFEDLLLDEYDINTTAISPVTYAQTQELQNKQISQINLSLMLAASLQNAGMKESAEAFADFSKQRRKEFGSRSVDNNVSVFSTGKLVGLEIQPEFFAATWDDSDPSMLLQQQTFPILLRFDTIGEKQFDELKVAKDCDKNDVTDDYCLLEPLIYVTPTTRWKSSSRSPWLLNSKEQLTTEELFNLQRVLKEECVKDYGDDVSNNFIKRKCEELNSKLFGDIQFTRLPHRQAEKTETKLVEFSHIFPSSVTLKRNEEKKIEDHLQDFVLIGKNLSSLKGKDEADIKGKIKSVFEGVEVQSVSVSGNTMTIRTNITEAKGPVIFIIEEGGKVISTAMSKNAIATLIIEEVKKKVSSVESETVIKLIADDNQSISVTLPVGVDDIPEHVLEVLKSFYEKPANITERKTTEQTKEN